MAIQQKPTKPLFTVRFTLVNTRYYSADELLKALRPALESQGYTVYQSPALRGYKAAFTVQTEEPFGWEEDGQTKVSQYETMTITGPDGKDGSTTRDLKDPSSRSPLLEKRSVLVSAFAWNIGVPTGRTTQRFLEDFQALLKSKFYDKNLYLGWGWTPIVNTWEATPIKKSPYPDRPAIPAVLLPDEPKPPAPKPVTPTPKPVTPIVQPPPIPPPQPITPTPSIFSDWRVWLGLGIVGVLVYLGADERRTKP